MAGSEGLKRDLAALLGADAVAPDDDMARFEESGRHGRGRAWAVIRPASTADVAQALRYCYRRKLGVIPQGANTGLVGAGTPDASGDQLVLSLERLRGVEVLDGVGRTAVAAAGTRLSELNRQAADVDLTFPIDLGADPTIGGMVATNTGGARLIRYGDVRRNLLGLEVVLADADATVLSDLRGLRKDNSGLDLTGLFAGSGGGLGIVTRACVELHRRPRQTATALALLTDHAAIPELIAGLEADAGEFLAACEGMSGNAMAAALRCGTRLRNPFGGEAPPPYALLVELTSTTSVDEGGPDLDGLLGRALGRWLGGDSPLLADVLIGRGEDLWALRHAISDSLKAEGRVIAFDLCVPRARLSAFRKAAVGELEARFPWLRICDFGHAGDGGDHFNLVWPHDAEVAFDMDVVAEVRDIVYDCTVARHGGCFSAEHGLGPSNYPYYRRYVAPEARAAAARVKRLFDPKGLLGHVDFS